MSGAWKVGALLLLIVGSVAATKILWPTEEVIRLPGSTDTVEVTHEKLDTVWRERVQWRERVTTDTLVLADTIFQTALETVAVLPGRWYLDSASIAASRGDTSYYALTWLAGDSSGIHRRERLERHVTLGPVRQIAADRSGLHVDYGEYRSCGVDMSGLSLDLPLGLSAGPGGGCGVAAGGGIDCVVGVSVGF